ncbi:MAG: KamA family radical SAM protein [Myxococcota bacterium]
MADPLFAVRVTRSFWSRIRKEDPQDPLALQVLPDVREGADEGLVDPVGDAACSPVPWVVHKYPDRALLLLTKRCHLYCRYCFRRTFSPTSAEDPSPQELAAAIAYIQGSGVREVILSGGDPLTVKDADLIDVIDRLRPTVPRIRIHTRAPITRPDRVTPELVAALRARRPVWVVVHCNHPAELSAEVDQALDRLLSAGVPVLNQSVLLRGINDDPHVLAELGDALVRRGVKPYYLHHTDVVRGAQHFTVSIEEGLQIYQQLRRLADGLSLPRYVIDPPDGSGKMDVEAYVAGQRR